MTFPASLAMGNITRLRNLEYMFIAVLSSALPPLSFRPKGGICCSTPPLSSRASSAASFVEWRRAGAGFLVFLSRDVERREPDACSPKQLRTLHHFSPSSPLSPSRTTQP